MSDRNLVLSQASIRELPRGTSLFRQEEPAKKLLLLESGRVRLYEIAENGRELLVRFVVPGEVLGDRAAIPGSNYEANAVSDGRVRIYVWSSATILRLLEKIPRLCTNLFAIVTTYLHYSRERHRLLATASAQSRVRWALNDIARRLGRPQGKGVAITGRALQTDIADLAVTTVYTVSRVLRIFEKRGLISGTRGHIVLLPSLWEGIPR